VLLLLGVMLLAVDANAQATRRPPHTCNRIGTTTFEFGRTGGNLRATPAVHIGVDGGVWRTTGPARTLTGFRIPADTLASLARLAWRGGFTKLPSAPTRPTRIPDAARDYIYVRSACGSKYVETVADEAAPAFRELLTRLTASVR
jgi:hypothetical protein